MKVFIDDGSTNIKMLWTENDVTKTYISPNSFRRGWVPAFGAQTPCNYTVENEDYSYDPGVPDTLATNNVGWQYSPLNTLAIQHALLNSGIAHQDVDVVVTLPLSEFFNEKSQLDDAKIERKKQSVQRAITVMNGKPFTIKSVSVVPESIPAGIALCDGIDEKFSVLIIDIGGTTLDIAQVAGKMTRISRVFGDPKLGVSLVTGEVINALKAAKTSASHRQAENFILHRDDMDYIRNGINLPEEAEFVKAAIDNGISLLGNRVADAVNTFDGFTHAVIVGGGASLVEKAIREKVSLPADRIIVSDDPQYALVRSLPLMFS